MPKGIGFFNIQSGETRYAQLEAQIQAYLNSSDIGINSSRDQDFGWRLSPDWVKKVKAFRRDDVKMQRLLDNNGGQKVTTPQILAAIYGEQVRAAMQKAEDNEKPFEADYLKEIGGQSEALVETVSAEEELDDNFDAVTADIDEEIKSETAADEESEVVESEEDTEATPEKPKAPKTPKKK